MIETVIFDADDTLWHNEILFTQTHEAFRAMLLEYHEAEWIDKTLYETQIKNLSLFGYGIKGFVLSMIETAIELTEGRVGGMQIQRVIDLGKEMLKAPVDPLPHVKDTLDLLSRDYQLMVITKGDLFDQESKVARSGLGDYFKIVEVVSEKTRDVYADVFRRHGLDPKTLIMIGNSLKSDVLPLLELNVHAVHIPYQTTWAHEMVPDDVLADKDFHHLSHMGQLPELLNALQDGLRNG